MAKTYSITVNGSVFTAPTQAEAIAMAKEFISIAHAPKRGQGNSQPTVEKTVAYKKADGTTVMCTPEQAKAWDKFKANSSVRKESFEQMKATWNAKREAYKPSEKLIKAIKTDRASITHKVAKTYGFVGTKDDLKALKDSICK